MSRLERWQAFNDWLGDHWQWGLMYPVFFILNMHAIALTIQRTGREVSLEDAVLRSLWRAALVEFVIWTVYTAWTRWIPTYLAHLDRRNP